MPVDTKISDLSSSSLNSDDYIITARNGGNYKIPYTNMYASSVMPEDVTGKLVQYSPLSDIPILGTIFAPAVDTPNLYTQNVTIGPDTQGFITFRASDGIYLRFLPSSDINDYTYSRDYYLPNEDGTLVVKDTLYDTVKCAGYQVNFSNFVYNSGNLTLTDLHNGKNIISTNTSGIVYTVASGLVTGFACSILQYGTGVISISGAAGATVNSYGGLTSIAGQYGSAYVSWVQNNAYILAGNLS